MFRVLSPAFPRFRVSSRRVQFVLSLRCCSSPRLCPRSSRRCPVSRRPLCVAAPRPLSRPPVPPVTLRRLVFGPAEVELLLLCRSLCMYLAVRLLRRLAGLALALVSARLALCAPRPRCSSLCVWFHSAQQNASGVWPLPLPLLTRACAARSPPRLPPAPPSSLACIASPATPCAFVARRVHGYARPSSVRVRLGLYPWLCRPRRTLCAPPARRRTSRSPCCPCASASRRPLHSHPSAALGPSHSAQQWSPTPCCPHPVAPSPLRPPV